MSETPFSGVRTSQIIVTGLVVAGAAAFLVRIHTPSAGDRLRPFETVALAGGSLRSSDLAGRVAVVNIWASWCGPCREELPKLDSLAARLDTSRVTFAALSDDRDGASARELLMMLGGLKHLRVGLGLGSLMSNFGIDDLPYTMLVDKNGHIVKTWTGYGGPEEIATIDSLISRLSAASAGH